MTRLTKCLVAAAVVAGFGFAAQSASAAPPNGDRPPDVQALPDLQPVHSAGRSPTRRSVAPILPRHDHDYLVQYRPSPFSGWATYGKFETRYGAETAAAATGMAGGPDAGHSPARLLRAAAPVVSSSRRERSSERSQGLKSLATFATVATKIFALGANHLVGATSLMWTNRSWSFGNDPVSETTRESPATATRLRAVQSFRRQRMTPRVARGITPGPGVTARGARPRCVLIGDRRHSGVEPNGKAPPC